jgi:PAS domain S-box-containing protein
MNMTGVDVEEARLLVQTEESHAAPIEVTWATEPSGEVHEDCPSWREFTGQTFEEIQGFGWLDVVHHEDRERVRKTWVSTIASGSIYVSEFRLRRSDGAIRHMSVRGVPAFAEGEVCKVAGFCGDITDAINYLHLIMREREFSNAVIECLPGVFYMTDESGNLIRWNRAAEMISGFTSEELAHKRGFDLVHPRHVERLHENRKKLFESGGSTELEAEFLTKSGQHVPFYVNGRRVFFHGKSYAMGVGLDISKQKNAEQQLRELNAVLEDRVKERTKELEESYKELEAFSYTVSHDLRAPLQAIRGFSEILKEDFAEQLKGEGNELLDRIIEADERMARLINDILSYARLEREGIKMEHVPLSELMRHVQADFELRLKEIGGQLEVARDLPEVEGDLTLLAQVFTNLFQNAINYRRKDTPLVLQVSSERRPDGIIVGVSDNGQGIAPQYQLKLFKPFQRLHSNAEVPGTGLGLSTVKKSVERMGGKVWLESEVNKGTTFFVRLKPA